MTNTFTMVFTGMAGFAALATWLVYRQIRDHTKQIERAYVTMSHRPPGLRFGYIKSNSEKPKEVRDITLVITVRNHGNTPAQITGTLVQMIATAEGLPPIPQYVPSRYVHTHVYLVKGDDITLNAHFEPPQEQVKIAKAFHPAMTMYVFGFVDYIDRFGVRHRAGYGRQYDPSIDSRDSAAYRDEAGNFRQEAYARRSNLPFITQAGYNYDRERKKGEGHDWEDPLQ